MRQLAWFLILTASLLITVGCKSEPVKPATASGMLIDPPEARKLGYNLSWSADLGVEVNSDLQDVVLLDDILVGTESPANLVTAVSVRDGTVLWREVVGDRKARLFTPTRWKDRVLINTENLLLMHSVANGRIVALNKLDFVTSNAPSVYNDVVIFGAASGRVYAHDIVAGSAKWAYLMPGGVFTRPLGVKGGVVAVDNTGHYAMLGGQSGGLLWKGRTFARITAEPVASTTTVFIPSEDNTLYAVFLENGRDRWSYRSTGPLTRSPVLLGNSLYLPLPGQGLAAIDAANGNELWRLPGDPPPARSRPDAGPDRARISA